MFVFGDKMISPALVLSLVYGHNVKSSNDFVGRVVIGQFSTGPAETTHWRRLLRSQRTPVEQWHSLRSRAECDRVSLASLEVTWSPRSVPIGGGRKCGPDHLMGGASPEGQTTWRTVMIWRDSGFWRVSCSGVGGLYSERWSVWSGFHGDAAQHLFFITLKCSSWRT